MIVRERHDPEHSTPESVKRHRRRYLYAIELAKDYGVPEGGIWWDVACGTGYGTVLMPGDITVGVDRDPQVIREATERYPDAPFAVADVGCAAWFADLTPMRPDVMLSIETLEHMDVYEQHAFLMGAAAALNGGTLVLACPLNTGVPTNNPWHRHEPTETQLRQLLARHFDEVLHFESDEYESSSGPAVQAYAVAR